jgi:hypothetical protein
MSKIVKNKVSTQCFVMSYICLVCHTSCKVETYSKTGHLTVLCVGTTNKYALKSGKGRVRSWPFLSCTGGKPLPTIPPLRLICDPNLQIENTFTCCCRQWLHTESIRLVVLDLDPDVFKKKFAEIHTLKCMILSMWRVVL